MLSKNCPNPFPAVFVLSKWLRFGRIMCNRYFIIQHLFFKQYKFHHLKIFFTVHIFPLIWIFIPILFLFFVQRMMRSSHTSLFWVTCLFPLVNAITIFAISAKMFYQQLLLQVKTNTFQIFYYVTSHCNWCASRFGSDNE